MGDQEDSTYPRLAQGFKEAGGSRGRLPVSDGTRAESGMVSGAHQVDKSSHNGFAGSRLRLGKGLEAFHRRRWQLKLERWTGPCLPEALNSSQKCQGDPEEGQNEPCTLERFPASERRLEKRGHGRKLRPGAPRSQLPAPSSQTPSVGAAVGAGAPRDPRSY